MEYAVTQEEVIMNANEESSKMYLWSGVASEKNYVSMKYTNL
jgi:hypothetical protein